MLKETIKSYVVCVVFYRILNYVYLLSISRYIACLGYKTRIILSIDNEWCHKVICAPSLSYFIIVNSGVVWGGVWRSLLVVMHGGREGV